MWRRASFCLFLAGTGCADYQVPAQEISRLSIELASAIAHLLEKDDNCGFESPPNKAGQRIEGVPGEVGFAIRSVENCELELSSASALLFGCDGEGEISGEVRVSAERRLVGLITESENPDEMLIPAGPDALTLELTSAEMIDFSVRDGERDNFITVREGTISGIIAPKLAEDENGFCGARTRHTGFQSINLERAMVRYTDAGREFNAIIQGSLLNAVRGEYADNENILQGEIAINGTRQRIPVSADDVELDPDYNAGTFEKTFACPANTTLKLPVAYECRGSGSIVAPPDLSGVADDLGRLSIRGFAQLVSYLDADPRCGFSSPTAKQSAVTDGPIGGEGTITFSSDRCLVDLLPGSVLGTDCSGEQIIAGGRVALSGKKTVRGRLTGDNSGDPVIPLTEDAVTIEVTEMRFDQFELVENNRRIRWDDGVLRGKLSPRLAYDTESTACSFATDIARFENLTYENTNVFLSEGDQEFSTTIATAQLQATSGLWGDKENSLSGIIFFAGQEYRMGGELQQTSLDPNYDRSAFDRSWQCGTVKLPVTHTCNITDRLAEAASRVAILALGNIGQLVNTEASCGFESTAVKQAVQSAGTVGDPGGSATFQMSSCQLQWPEGTSAGTDCNGKTTTVRGSARITGTKRLDGWLTGDVNEPIIPTTRDAVAIVLDIELQDFKISFANSEDDLTIRSGRLSGILKPRAAVSLANGTCTLGTPVVTFENVVWQNAAVTATYQGKRFDATILSSALNAQSGGKDGVENRLNGSITVDGETWFTPADLRLDPEYDRNIFERSYQSCNGDMRIPASDAECDFRPQLAEQAARGIVLAGATAASLIHADTNCGFSDSNVQENPTRVTGDSGDYGTMDFAVNNCSISRGSSSQSDAGGNIYDFAQRINRDCLNRGLYAKGRITASARETVEGERDEIWFTDVIYPRKPNSLIMNLDQVSIQDLTLFTRDDTETPLSRLIIHSGTLSGVVYPMTGARADERAEYTIATPVAKLERLVLSNGDVTLIDEDGKHFNLRITTSDLNAYNGMYNNDGNRIAGNITIDGQTTTLAPAGLDPVYNQTDFDQRYACTNNLYQTLPPNSAVGRP
jgi:hypothetical protein